MARRSKALVVTLISALFLAGATIASPQASALNSRLVYGVNPYCNGADVEFCSGDENGLVAFDANSGDLAGPGKVIDVTSGPDNTANLTVQNAQGLAMDPTTGDAWAVLRFGDFGSQVRYLATIDLDTGQAVAIDRLKDTAGHTQRIASITFDDAGVLYAVSGDGNYQGGSDCKECLYTVNLGTAQLTKVADLGNGGAGEAIAFNSDDGLLYHASGDTGGAPEGPMIFESIDPANAFAVTGIPYSGDSIDEVFGMVYDPTEGNLLVTDDSHDIVHVSTNGFVTNFGAETSEPMRGLIVLDPESSVAVDDEFNEQQDTTNNTLDVLDNDIAGSVNSALVVQTASDPAHGTTRGSDGRPKRHVHA